MSEEVRAENCSDFSHISQKLSLNCSQVLWYNLNTKIKQQIRICINVRRRTISCSEQFVTRKMKSASTRQRLFCSPADVAFLAVNGDNGYPYAIPINYVYDDDAQKIYFHGARAGHKVDALRACDKVCFTVYGNETIKEEDWAPFVQSVVVFGRCHLIESGARATTLLKRFAMKYYPSEQLVDEEIAHAGKAVQMFEIDVEYLSGKEIQER